MGFEQISDNIFITTDETFFDVVAGAIVLPTKIVMIDSGINIGEIKKFRTWVEETTGKKFEFLVCTHFHGDHTLGNQVFSDCKIIAPEIHLEYMKMLQKHYTPENIKKEQERLKDPRALKGLVITIPTDTFENGGSYEIVDGEVKVIIKHVGGHTVDSLYVYSPTYKTLFAGDNLFVDSHPYGGHSSCNPDKWMDVFKEILSLDVEIIIPGHGPVTDKSYVEKELAKFEEMKKIMKQLVKDGKSDEEVKNIILNQFFAPEVSEEPGDSIFRESTVVRFYDYWINGVE